MQNKGFTLIEVLIVLSVLSIFIVLFPMFQLQKNIALRYEVMVLRERLLQAQIQAWMQKKDVSVDFQGNSYRVGEVTYHMNSGVSCHATPFHFTPTSTTSNALSIQCDSSKKSKKLVVQLGSGRIHEK